MQNPCDITDYHQQEQLAGSQNPCDIHYVQAPDTKTLLYICQKCGQKKPDNRSITDVWCNRGMSGFEWWNNYQGQAG